MRQRLESDDDNCGACGNVCAEGASCNDGNCECDDAGEIVCGGGCVDVDDEDNCGSCGKECDGFTFACPGFSEACVAVGDSFDCACP